MIDWLIGMNCLLFKDVIKSLTVKAHIDSLEVSNKLVKFKSENTIIRVPFFEDLSFLIWMNLIPKFSINLTMSARILSVSPRIS
jgi:hypothetical protein